MSLELRFAPAQAKSQLPHAKYESLTVSVSRFLCHTLSQPDGKLDVAWARSFVGAYAQDVARHLLGTLGNAERTQRSPQELSIRVSTLELARRLATVCDGLNASALVDLAIAYGATNSPSVQTVFADALRSTPALLEEFRTDVVPAFVAALQSPDKRIAHVLSHLLHCAPQVALLFAEDQAFLMALAAGYHAKLEDIAASRGGMDVDDQKTVEQWQKDWLYTKTGLLDVFHAITQALIQSPLPKSADCLFDALFMMLDLPSPSSGPKAHFISQPLLTDYQYAFDLSRSLKERFGNLDDARVDLLVVTLNDFAPTAQGPKPAGALSILLKERARSPNTVHVPVADLKGKARAVDQNEDDALNPAVAQVLEIFPSETPEHISRCLRHHVFDGNPEKLISALLEGTLPADLAENNEEKDAPEEEYEFTKNRLNIWDDNEMDFSRLRIGKTRNDANTLFQDRTFIEEMKADIIRRAQELCEDEDEAGEQRDRKVPFDEDLDDNLESLIGKGVRVSGDGEDSDTEKGSNPEDHAAVHSPETILELAYLEDPKLFDRDAATRRSKSRAELKVSTGWGDEQIEGWKIMLERNPNKDKILEKHEFRGNTPLMPNRNDFEPQPGPSNSSRDEPSHRGGGGRGRGGGRGGRGDGGNSGRDRAWKDKNKARQANHDRKRGHAKKMLRGVGTPV